MNSPFSPQTSAAQQAAQASELVNPANLPAKAPVKRIPLSVPTLKLTVPEIPGYVCHWFRGSEGRIQQALAAGYTFVDRGTVELNQHGLANDFQKDGNSDLGNRVSVPSGDDSSRMYLMKLPRELWEEDGKLLADKHEQIASQLRGDQGLSLPAGFDRSNRYSRGESRNLFTPRRG
jgi:hypothetical protein